MLHIVTLLWKRNRNSEPFSTAYTEEWVNRLYRGFARNLTRPFRFVCFTDYPRNFAEPVAEVQIEAREPDYGTCIEPYRLDEPMILVGLDTLVTGSVDHLADYCLRASQIALPRSPRKKGRSCNGVALVPAGHRRVYDDWRGENDVSWMNAQPHVNIDVLFPGHVRGYKHDVKHNGLGDTRIVYFHGPEKMHEISEPWLAEHWA